MTVRSFPISSDLLILSCKIHKVVTAIIISGILQGLLLVALLCGKGFNKIPNQFLAILIFLLSAHLGLIAMDMQDLFLQYPHLSRLSWLLPVCYGPLILLLTQSITDRNFSVRKIHLLYFSPFFIYLTVLLPYYFSGASDKLVSLSDHEKMLNADFGWMNHLTNYFHIGFVLTALITYNSRKHKLSKFDETSEKVNLRWLGHFLWAVLSIMVFSLLTFYTKKIYIKFFSDIYPKHFLLVVILVYWIAYKLLQEKSDFTNRLPLETEKESLPKYSKTGLNFEASRLMGAQLKEYVELNKPYLDSGLTITELGNKLSLTKHQISQVINSEFEVNFYEFINDYRVNEFKKLSLDPVNGHLSLLGIAFESGFNSKATFNQAFKKKEGITPSEFLKQYKAQVVEIN